MPKVNWNHVLYIIGCGGWGTRFSLGAKPHVPKVLFPLDDHGHTTLEYHLRAVPIGASIGLAAGRWRRAIRNYLEGHDYFGHHRSRVVWIPDRYRSPVRSHGGVAPRWPMGAAAWLLYGRMATRAEVAASGGIVVQTAGNKLGFRLSVVERMLGEITPTTADCVAATLDLDMAQTAGNVLAQYDFVRDGKVLLKGHASPGGKALAYWYVFTTPWMHRLLRQDLRSRILDDARRYPERRRWRDQGRNAEVDIVDISFPKVLRHMPFRTLGWSGAMSDWGVEMRTREDIRRCSALFGKREREGLLRRNDGR